jgi:hypothetical protein
MMVHDHHAFLFSIVHDYITGGDDILMAVAKA